MGSWDKMKNGFTTFHILTQYTRAANQHIHTLKAFSFMRLIFDFYLTDIRVQNTGIPWYQILPITSLFSLAYLMSGQT